MSRQTKFEMRRCPFCGHVNKTVFWADEKNYWVSCDCGATGPIAETEEKAVELWNTRYFIELKNADAARTELSR